MTATKRSTKIVSYKEQENDDDDFVSTADQKRKSRTMKSVKASSRKLPEQPDPTPQVCIHIPGITAAKEDTSQRLTIPPVNAHLDCSSSPEDGSCVDEAFTADDHENDASPKLKRMKHDEEIPAMSILDLNVSLPLAPDRPIVAAAIPDEPKRRHSLPLGFPTSKIHIPSTYASRVGLSRKSSSIRPLHPAVHVRPAHE